MWCFDIKYYQNSRCSEAQNYVKNRNNTILNNLIEIFTNDAYSDLKKLAKLKKTLDFTPFPQKTEDYKTAMQECKELGIVSKFNLGGVTINKIDLTEIKNLSPEEQKERLSLLGFHNTQYNQLEFLIHAIENGKQVGGIDYLTSQFKSDATLSTSIITMANTATYRGRTYGFIMEPDKTKVLSAETSNISSGCGKGRNVSGKYISQSNKMNYTNC